MLQSSADRAVSYNQLLPIASAHRALMERGGTRNFSIFRQGLTLFAYQERDTPGDPHAPIDPIVWKWWEMMAPYMETNPDFSPVQEPLEEVFHAD